MNDEASNTGAGDPELAATGGRSTLERIGQCVERVALGFDRWDDPHARGPGLYFVVVADSVDGFSDQMGTNRWPVAACPSVLGDADSLVEAARAVALSRDGAVVVHEDGTIEERMVRLTPPSGDGVGGELPYADWMGARHMSALETSTRDPVVAAVTLSEEDGRVTVFRNGEYECDRYAVLAESGRSGT